MAEETKPSLMARLKRGLFMTHTELIARVGDAIKARFSPDPKALEALEEALLAADVGPATAAELVEAVRVEAGPAGRRGGRRRPPGPEGRDRAAALGAGPPVGSPAPGQPRVVLMVGRERDGKDDDRRQARRARGGGRRKAASSPRPTRSAPPRSTSSRSGRSGSESRSSSTVPAPTRPPSSSTPASSAKARGGGPPPHRHGGAAPHQAQPHGGALEDPADRGRGRSRGRPTRSSSSSTR